jgi:hypothetical protein
MTDLPKKLFAFYVVLVFILLTTIAYAQPQTCVPVKKLVDISKEITSFALNKIDQYKIFSNEIPPNDIGQENKAIEKCWIKNGCDGKGCAEYMGKLMANLIIEEENNLFKMKKVVRFYKKIINKLKESNLMTAYKLTYCGFIHELSLRYNELQSINQVITLKDLKQNGKLWASNYSKVPEIKSKYDILFVLLENEDSSALLPHEKSATSTDKYSSILSEMKRLNAKINALSREIDAIKSRLP